MHSLTDFFPTPDTIRSWASVFDNTGIDEYHLYHIIAGQAAALMTLNLVANAPSTGKDLNYRPTLDQVEGWVSPVKDRLSKEEMLEYVAEQGATWVVHQLKGD
jgi:hypothetical protein